MFTKSYVYLVVVLVFLGFSFAEKKSVPKSARWIICENSSLVVNGSTNLTRFSCAIGSYPNSDTINVDRDKSTKKIALSGNISMAIAGFDCKNRMMTKELRRTLKQDQFPAIQIEFISINGLPELNRKPVALKGVVEIEIAGKRKRFDISYVISIDANKEIHLIAVRDINFSDFGLNPPKKFGKFVQAKDKLSVELNLIMKMI